MVWQIKNGILSQLCSLPLSASLFVSCSGPLLLSQADSIARRWRKSKQKDSMTMSARVQYLAAHRNNFTSLESAHSPAHTHMHTHCATCCPNPLIIPCPAVVCPPGSLPPL